MYDLIKNLQNHVLVHQTHVHTILLMCIRSTSIMSALLTLYKPGFDLDGVNPPVGVVSFGSQLLIVQHGFYHLINYPCSIHCIRMAAGQSVYETGALLGIWTVGDVQSQWHGKELYSLPNIVIALTELKDKCLCIGSSERPR